ncbi:MAG TPA: alpha/beta hydrolase-fold protein [Terriglobales bacterium]|jgi:predicted alpha/beta superfamily hydrolase|nr:alpha/beta hydrolase-fold protein [Terriglobales bacterium]
MEEVSQEQSVPQNDSVTGDLRLHEFRSRIFRNTRMLRVWLPPRYDAPENSARLYPVLYLNDGQNLFNRTIAFGGVEWQVDETADRLIRQEVIVPLIIVGIDNAQGERIKEYLPFRSFNPPILRPLGKRYPNFLINEVIPFVCERYRVARGPENSALGGSSLGALISLYTVIQRPEVFGGLLLESPSLFISYRRIVKFSRLVRQWPAKVFLAIGTREAGREDKDRQVVEDVRELERTLRRAGLDDRRLLVKVDEGATHNESEWAKRFPEALSFLFTKS